MKSCFIQSGNGGTSFLFRDVPEPQPKAGEIVVRVRAASLNRGELLAQSAHYQADQPRPAGGDAAGEVHAVGEGVTVFKRGDRVMGRGQGCFSEYATLRAEQVVPLPERLSWEHGAAVPLAYVTVYEMLFTYGRLKAGETLLVTGASSGVGVGCIQTGKAIGAKVIATSRSADKLAKLKSAGIDVSIESRDGKFADKMLEATGKEGANLAINLVGGGIFPELVRSLANKGRLAIVGSLDGAKEGMLDLSAVHAKRLQIFGVSNARMSPAERAEAMRGFARDMLPMFADGRIVPLVDKVFPFDELPAAKRYVEGNSQVGKVVVRFA
ncbi:MAG TPA: zinc-binding dehydrogenase [Burkholderiales bacterium]|nr:zinc-binding dehydrogenase [Burkholderiales bacterium]